MVCKTVTDLCSIIVVIDLLLGMWSVSLQRIPDKGVLFSFSDQI